MKDFEKINWLPVSERFSYYLCSNAFKFFKETCTLYFHDTYRQSGQNHANILKQFVKLLMVKYTYLLTQNLCDFTQPETF